jgi:NADH:ubiquinone oxidoreductase subunit 6 (subunit J)
MDPIAVHAAFRVALLILIAAAVMLPFQPPNSAEFVVTVLAGVIGLIFVGIVAVLARLSGSRPPNPRPVDRVSGIDSNMRNEEPGRGK